MDAIAGSRLSRGNSAAAVAIGGIAALAGLARSACPRIDNEATQLMPRFGRGLRWPEPIRRTVTLVHPASLLPSPPVERPEHSRCAALATPIEATMIQAKTLREFQRPRAARILPYLVVRVPGLPLLA